MDGNQQPWSYPGTANPTSNPNPYSRQASLALMQEVGAHLANADLARQYAQTAPQIQPPPQNHRQAYPRSQFPAPLPIAGHQPPLGHPVPREQIAAQAQHNPGLQQLQQSALPRDQVNVPQALAESAQGLQSQMAYQSAMLQPQRAAHANTPRAAFYGGAEVPMLPRTLPAQPQANPSSGVALHPVGYASYPSSNSRLQEAMRQFRHSAQGEEATKVEFLTTYLDLLEGFEQKCEEIFQQCEKACENLVLNAKVPELPSAPSRDGPGNEDDAEIQAVLKRKFVEAMEKLQTSNMPKRRRGNLPKEATSVFKKWFDDHSSHPYPTDEEKQELARITGTGQQQITNWFINHRKRVWKPSQMKGSRPMPHPGGGPSA